MAITLDQLQLTRYARECGVFDTLLTNAMPDGSIPANQALMQLRGSARLGELIANLSEDQMHAILVTFKVSDKARNEADRARGQMIIDKANDRDALIQSLQP